MAIRVMVSPLISTFTPVSSGRVSSFEAATVTCEIASANTSAATVPATGGMVGSCGYSSTGRVASAKRALPQRTWSFVPSSATVTSLFGRARTMSESMRPWTSTSPGCSISASRRIWALTS